MFIKTAFVLGFAISLSAFSEKITEITIEQTGGQKYSEEKIADQLIFKEGEEFSSEKLKQEEKRLVESGLFKSVEIIQKKEKESIELTYHLATEQLKLGEIKVSGNNITREDVITREVPIVKGENLTLDVIKKTEANLSRTGLFDSVKVSSSGVGSNKNLDIEVEERLYTHARVGVGYNDYYGIMGLFELEHENFDHSNSSKYFSGGGQKLKLSAAIGARRQNLHLSFSEPHLTDKLSLNLAGYFKTFNYSDWNERYAGAVIGFGYQFNEKLKLKLSHRVEQVKVSDMDLDLSQIFQDEVGYYNVSTMTFEAIYDSITTKESGWLSSVLLGVNSKVFGADSDYYRLETKGEYQHKFAESDITFMTLGKLGVLDSSGSIERVPIFERYFLGGADTVRGFPFREIGPTDENDDVYGGESMALITAEVIHPIYDIFYGAVFIDAGNSWDRSYNIKLTNLNVGAGYGLRIKVPKTRMHLNVDVAYPINIESDNVDKKWRFHVNMGYQF